MNRPLEISYLPSIVLILRLFNYLYNPIVCLRNYVLILLFLCSFIINIIKWFCLIITHRYLLLNRSIFVLFLTLFTKYTMILYLHHCKTVYSYFLISVHCIVLTSHWIIEPLISGILIVSILLFYILGCIVCSYLVRTFSCSLVLFILQYTEYGEMVNM